MAIVEADAQPLTPFEQDVAAMQRYFDSPRFEGSFVSIRPAKS